MRKKYSPTQISGLKAESLAYEYLLKNGLKLVTRNYRNKFGELDLIMEDENTLIFIEVRMRKFNAFVKSIETIDFYKQKRIIKTAMTYLQRYPTWKSSRIDVVAIDLTSQGKEISWIQDAFQVQ